MRQFLKILCYALLRWKRHRASPQNNKSYLRDHLTLDELQTINGKPKQWKTNSAKEMSQIKNSKILTWQIFNYQLLRQLCSRYRPINRSKSCTWGAYPYMKITLKINVIFPHSDRYRTIKVTTAGLNLLLLATGGPKINLPLRALNKFKSFLLSFLRHWSRFLYFLIERNSFLEYVDKFWEIFIENYVFEKKNQNFDFPKIGKKLKISNKSTFFKSSYAKTKIIMNKFKIFPIHKKL